MSGSGSSANYRLSDDLIHIEHTASGERFLLTPREAIVYLVLDASRGNYIRSDRLLDVAFNWFFFAGSRDTKTSKKEINSFDCYRHADNLRVQISAIRKKAGPKVIENLHGFGYIVRAAS